MKKRSWGLLISFTLLIVLSCTINLLSLNDQSIRLDESQSLWTATKSIPALAKHLAEDVHVPLFFIILHFWTLFFGTDIFVARIPSLIFYIATFPFIYTLAKESSNKKVALVTVAVFSLSPFVAWYSNEARMYTLFTLITTLNHIFFLRFYRSEGKKYKFAYFITSVLGIYTHYFFFFLLFSQGVYVLTNILVSIYKDSEFGKASLWKMFNKHKGVFWVYLGLVGSTFMTMVPWGIYVLKLNAANNASPLIARPTSFNIFQTIVQFIFGFQNQTIQAFIIALWPLSLVMLFLLFTKRKKIPSQAMEYFGLVTVLPIILVFFISFIRPIFLSRYLILVTPTLFFILSWSFMSYSGKVARLFVITILSTMAFLSLYQNISAATPVKENYMGVSRYLGKNTTPQDIIAVSAPFTVYPIEYSYLGQARIATIPEWDRYVSGTIPDFSIDKLDAQIKEYKKQYTHVYVVLSYDQGYEKKIVDYMDKNYEIYKVVQFSPGLQIRSYVLRYDSK